MDAQCFNKILGDYFVYLLSKKNIVFTSKHNFVSLLDGGLFCSHVISITTFICFSQ